MCVFVYLFVNSSEMADFNELNLEGEFWNADGSTQALYKDRHSYGRSTMSTQLVGVFNFPILKFEEGKSAPGVAFCSKGSVFRNGGVHPSGKPSNWFIFEIIVDC